ncbi:NAB [Mytilus edulis]|uniref:NAB n=1 Tax=Mytilus edulis TaxID=6550 RepID=A0A8S3U1B8_MYTED|nr:NAB [Mytilus edulis]
MATNQPQNLSEWQLHCVLKRASLIQYYDSFINNGEVDVIKLAESDDIVFKDIMEKVGMAKKPLHVRQFRNTLLEWTKDPGKNKHVPSYIQTADDAKCATAVLSLKSTAVSGSNSRLPQSQNDDDEKWKKQNEHCTIFKSEKTGIQPKQHTKSNQTQRVVKEDREEIIKPTTQRERNRVLLDILTERPYGTKEGLKDVLQESDPLNSDVQEILIHEHVIKLQKNYLMFVNDMDCKTDILDHLYETGVLDTEEKEEVYNYSLTRHESVTDFT